MPLYKVVTWLQINNNNAQKKRNFFVLFSVNKPCKFVFDFAFYLSCFSDSRSREVPCPLDLLVTFRFTRFGFMINGSWRKPWGDGSWTCLLSHAVVTDYSVKPSPWVGILCRVVGIQGGWYASLMLVDKSIWAAVIVCEGFVHHKEHYAGEECKCQAYQDCDL